MLDELDLQIGRAARSASSTSRRSPGPSARRRPGRGRSRQARSTPPSLHRRGGRRPRRSARSALRSWNPLAHPCRSNMQPSPSRPPHRSSTSRSSTACSSACCGWRPRSSTTPTGCGRTASGVKVGGHQASSASMVSLMTALWFACSRRPTACQRQAARVAGAARDQLPARPARPPLPDDAARSSAGCSPTRRARRTPTRSTTRPARSASARRRRSGARSRTATWPGTSTCRSAGARSR